MHIPNGQLRGVAQSTDMDDVKRDERNIVHIRNKDKVCMARAIVTARAHHGKQKDRTVNWKDIRQGKCKQDDACESHPSQSRRTRRSVRRRGVTNISALSTQVPVDRFHDGSQRDHHVRWQERHTSLYTVPLKPLQHGHEFGRFCECELLL